jgi:non-specific serine/threonine protein kinase
MTATAPITCYRFGHFELQPDERRLLASGAPVHVGPRALDLLVMLVERSARLVTKDELLERAWPKLVVEENTLQVHISALRKVLGPEAIATVSGRGYRFTPEVAYIAAGVTPHAAAATHNLPQQLTSFIGRVKEIAELSGLLTDTRLLTLTGAGGCGKTRLAMQLAAGLTDAYPDGVWLVELAALADPGMMPQAVANVLGVKEQPGKSLTQTMIEYLAQRHMLLVLDNAEHVLAACAQLADALLHGCGQLLILVTSRERLGIAGELTYRVPSLSMPDPKQDLTPEQISACESARLFIERARLQRPHFAVTAENAPALAAICHRLDGIPLAIELAAPRVRSMSVEEVSRRLDQRFDLLTGGSRTALPRHRTLRSMIDWSYDLLGDAEKATLRRVSVFSGGWTLEAAEQVCSSEVVDRSAVLDLLTSLADKNLVAAEEHAGETRYGLLETVRQYALDQLREIGEEAGAQRQHFDCFLQLAEKAEPRLTGPEQKLWLDRLEAEHDNVRSALAWSSAPDGDALGGLRLAGAAFWFWYVRGHRGEGRRCLSGLLAAAPDGQAPTERAKALRGAGVLAFGQGDYPAARTLCHEGLAICRQLGDRAGAARLLNILGIVAEEQGDSPAARALLEEGLTIRRELDDHSGIATSLNNLARLVMNSEADFPAASALFDEALQIYRKLGDRRGMAMVLQNLGGLAHQVGDYPAARPLAEESLVICRELGDRTLMANTLNTLGLIAFEQGDHRGA